MKKCHHTAFKKPCIERDCPKWVKLRGTNPQTGVDVDEEACADTWMPILLVEVSQKLVRLDATMESARNQAAADGVTVAKALAAVGLAAVKVRDQIERATDIAAAQLGAGRR